MSKLHVVPEEQDENMGNAFDVATTGWDGCNSQSMWEAMLAAAPPPPADIAEAIVEADQILRLMKDTEYPPIAWSHDIARALLKSWGRE